MIGIDPTGEWLFLPAVLATFAVAATQCQDKSANSCENAYPNHRDRFHPDFNKFIQCQTGAAGMGAAAAGSAMDPLGTLATEIGGALGNAASD